MKRGRHRETHPQRGRPHEDRRRHQSDGAAGTHQSHQEVEEAMKDSAMKALMGARPCQHLDF